MGTSHFEIPPATILGCFEKSATWLTGVSKLIRNVADGILPRFAWRIDVACFGRSDRGDDSKRCEQEKQPGVRGGDYLNTWNRLTLTG